MGKQKSKKKKSFIIVLCVAAEIMIAGDWVLSVMIYNENFNKRFESYEPLMLHVNDFDGWLTSMNLMQNLTNGSKHLITIITPKKTKNDFPGIKPDTFTTILIKINGVIG